MDDHFEQMLAPSTAAAYNQPKFTPTESFEGSKFGFIFKKGAKGLGYYYDHIQKQPMKVDGYDYQSEDIGSKKRKHDDDNDEVNEDDLSRVEEAQLKEEERKGDMERMLDEAEANIEQLDSNSLKQLLLSFEKKITKNLKMRMKHIDEPEKFMESELELHAEINELYAIAASPELYPTFVEAGSVNSILGMITHENTDISIAAVGLVHEMTDVDTILEEEVAMVFVDCLLASQGLELLVQNLSRLDESNDEDAQGVNSSMGCIENLIEIRPDIALLICERTHILKFLLLRLKVKKFDANKLYCSEILSILLQADESNQRRVCNLQGLDGMECLLQAASLYRKKDPGSPDEEEYLENLFTCLSTILLQKENQRKFLICEGMELMIRCLNERKYAAACALRAISYAVSNNKSCCQKFISSGGLKLAFPVLMGRGLPKPKKKSSRKGSYRNSEEIAITIISQLIIQLHDCTDFDVSQRLLFKITENNGEKLDRCSELSAKYAKILLLNEKQIESTAEALKEGEDEDELEEFLEPDNIYAMRLDGGLSTLQGLSTIIIFACLYDKVNNSISKSQVKLESEDLCLEDLVNVLREAAVHLYEKENKKPDDGDNGGGNDIINKMEGKIKGEIKGEKDVKADDLNTNSNFQIINGKGESEKEKEQDREMQRKLFVDWSTSIGVLLDKEEEEGDGDVEEKEEDELKDELKDDLKDEKN